MPATAIRPRLSGPQRRAAILEVAIEVFSQKGFRGTTTRELAAAVGVSEPVLYQHFATKRALYEAILDIRDQVTTGEVASELEKHIDSGDSRAFFTLLARIGLAWYCNDPRYARLLVFSALEKHELSDLFYERQVTVFYDWVTRHINKQVRRRKMRRVNALLAARIFAGMVSHQGMIFAIYHPGDLADSEEHIVKSIVDIFLQGISL